MDPIFVSRYIIRLLVETILVPETLLYEQRHKPKFVIAYNIVSSAR